MRDWYWIFQRRKRFYNLAIFKIEINYRVGEAFEINFLSNFSFHMDLDIQVPQCQVIIIYSRKLEVAGNLAPRVSYHKLSSQHNLVMIIYIKNTSGLLNSRPRYCERHSQAVFE